MFILITGHDGICALLCHCREHTPILGLLNDPFEQRRGKRYSQLFRGSSHGCCLTGAPGVTRCEISHPGHCRNGFSQQLKALAPNLEPGICAYARDVTAWPGNAVDNSKGDRVGHESNDGGGAVAALKFSTRREAFVTIKSGFRPTTSRANSA
jgi:hypothetical protein